MRNKLNNKISIHRERDNCVHYLQRTSCMFSKINFSYGLRRRTRASDSAYSFRLNVQLFSDGITWNVENETVALCWIFAKSNRIFTDKFTRSMNILCASEISRILIKGKLLQRFHTEIISRTRREWKIILSTSIYPKWWRWQLFLLNLKNFVQLLKVLRNTFSFLRVRRYARN